MSNPLPLQRSAYIQVHERQLCAIAQPEHAQRVVANLRSLGWPVIYQPIYSQAEWLFASWEIFSEFQIDLNSQVQDLLDIKIPNLVFVVDEEFVPVIEDGREDDTAEQEDDNGRGHKNGRQHENEGIDGGIIPAPTAEGGAS